MSTFTKNLIQNPKRLFLIDAGGALLSAFLLGFVLVRLESIFGIPQSMLYWLAAFPCLFLVLDLLFYFKAPLDKGLLWIGSLNLAYCLLSIALAISHWEQLLLPGYIYLLSEILIVFGLGLFEVKLAKSVKTE